MEIKEMKERKKFRPFGGSPTAQVDIHWIHWMWRYLLWV
jgi:hypothetical protein